MLHRFSYMEGNRLKSPVVLVRSLLRDTNTGKWHAFAKDPSLRVPVRTENAERHGLYNA